MGKLEDPSFRYYTKAESEQPGYLEMKMQIYREMVKHEQNGAVRSQSQDPGIGSGGGRQVHGHQENSQGNPKLIMVAGKG